MRKPETLTGLERVEAYYKNLIDNERKLRYYCADVNWKNDQIANEDDSWWRNTDKMSEWMIERQKSFIQLFMILAASRIFFTKPGLYFSKDFIPIVKARIEAAKKDLKEQLDEAAKQKELDRYRNLRLNFAGLKEILQKMGSIVKERQEKLEQLNAKISSESAAAREKLEEMYPKEMEEYDENSFKDDDSTANSVNTVKHNKESDEKEA